MRNLKRLPVALAVAAAIGGGALFLSQTEPGTIFANGFDPPVPVGCPASVTLDGIPRTRLTVSNIAYGASLTTRPAVRLDEYGAVYSYNSGAPGPVLPFPGLAGSAPRYMAFRPSSYIGLRFTVPADIDPRSAGRWMAPSAWPGSLPITVAVSSACGDFSAHLPSTGCRVQGVPAADAQLVFWTLSGASPATSCVLRPGGVYYLNIAQTDPGKQPACSGNVCQAPAAWIN